MASSCFLPFSVTIATVVFFFFSTSSLAAVDHHSNRAPLPVPGISIETPVRKVTLDPNSSLCVPVRGISRFKLLSYASLFHVSLDASAAIPKKLDSKIHVCFHRDNSLGLCQCQKDKWSSVQKGTWSAAMSPFENGYLDMRFNSQESTSVTISLEEDTQKRLLICLVLGYVLLLFGANISRWVLCCCSHSKAIVIGVFLVPIISLLFQLGAESFPSHQLLVIVNYICQTFGFGEEMHHKVANFGILSIMLAGAALFYSVVSKFVFSEQDGTRNAWVSQFGILKWETRIIGFTFIFQSTIDPPLAIGTLAAIAVVYIIMKCLNVWSSIPIRYKGSVNGGTADTDESMRAYHSSQRIIGLVRPKETEQALGLGMILEGE
ncbi:hypothetical protein PIB30_058457 [Stylosanthes scabra]|uniref:Uncharacterized protein n=1 Tax=Stylosanthes scabra TaxID=79078 RepID=A0ABU6UM19_9FABA|nr:hypothetical protein [Stylosanthes scabra]